jgi:protein SCO1
MISPTYLKPSSNLAVCRSYIAVLFCVLIAAAGCNRPSEPPKTAMRSYEARGVIRGFGPDRRSIDIEHEDIRGFMPAMTMPFAVRDSKQISGMQIGDAISFRLTVTDNDSWIDQIKKISASEVRLPVSTATSKRGPSIDDSPRVREGDMMPPFELTDQSGERITLETFRGHPFVLTFIFTRCPIPNFCPLMSKNFSDLQKAVKDGSGKLAQMHLLSISFDPEFDTPQILETYADHAQADPKIWTFATGEKSKVENLTRAFSVYVQTEGGTISHGLATALITENGKIAKIWRGNGWTPSEVTSEIKADNRSAR